MSKLLQEFLEKCQFVRTGEPAAPTPGECQVHNLYPELVRHRFKEVIETQGPEFLRHFIPYIIENQTTPEGQGFKAVFGTAVGLCIIAHQARMGASDAEHNFLRDMQENLGKVDLGAVFGGELGLVREQAEIFSAATQSLQKEYDRLKEVVLEHIWRKPDILIQAYESMKREKGMSLSFPKLEGIPVREVFKEARALEHIEGVCRICGAVGPQHE